MDLKMDQDFWKDKKVIITGHTGFKGSWLSFLLTNLGSKICGISLNPEEESLFNHLSLEKKIFQHNIFNINDLASIKPIFTKFNPDFVFHLAAQPLVRRSYSEPILTWETNVIGSLKVLEASKSIEKKCVVIIVTTDKVYNNRNWEFGYRENDLLGGFDPYSSSKAALEMLVSSWRNSFCGDLPYQSTNIKVATARSGNVIGGGDLALDRIVPDAIKAIISKQAVVVRNPNHTRPWQHVLEPLKGYLDLAGFLYKNNELNDSLESFNFGPNLESNKSVEELISEIFKHWDGDWVKDKLEKNFYESKLLHLQIDKAFKILGWKPKWDFQKTVEKTVYWYKDTYLKKLSYEEACLKDIEEFYNSKLVR